MTAALLHMQTRASGTATLYDYIDRRVTDLGDDDVFILSAVRSWVAVVRNGRCAQAALRSGFAARRVEGALLAFDCAMTIVDRYGYGTMRFAPICCHEISDDETRILNLFVAARCSNPLSTSIAASVVEDEMAMRLADAVAKVDEAMR